MSDADVTPTAGPLPDGLAAWMVQQRWYAGKGGTPALTVLGAFALPCDGGDVETLLVLDHSATAPALYQVPLVRTGDGEQAIPGTGGLADGPRTTAYPAALLAFAIDGTVNDGTVIDGTVIDGTAIDGTAVDGTAVDDGAAGGDGVRAEPQPLGWSGPPPVVARARVLSGEQSNTSVILDTERDGAPSPAVIVKVFRTLHHGDNPDVVLQSAIAEAGSRRVPRTYAAVVGEWPDPAQPGGRARGHLAVAQEFLAETQDAWRVALGSARLGEDFTAPARDLGAATAEVHGILAAAFPVVEPSAAVRAGLLASMRGRAARAAALVPEVAGEAAAIDAALVAAQAGEWPPFQRVHGDFHLGQVLLVPGRGWVLLDFEGEPLRPMAERNLPDVPLRDVAGMLRSFDYVAGTVAQEGGDASAWAAAARTAFLEGYEDSAGVPLARYAPLLAALELDKALYECEYEARNRPDWLPIPERAIRRLLEAAQ